MKLAKDDWFIALYLSVLALLFAIFLMYQSGFDPFDLKKVEPISATAICNDLAAKGEQGVQPLMRQEPDFRNIYQEEFIVLEFDLEPQGDVNWRTITVLQYCSADLIAPAALAVAKWQYCPMLTAENARDRQGIKVQFTVQPPKPITPRDLLDIFTD